jgi:DNA polymerase-3 subunit epsilon
MRQIVLDTETTGIDPAQGHRVIEIGAVELIDRKLTGNHFHEYIQPERDIPQEAIEIHGITPEFLADKPVFAAIGPAFLEFIGTAELVIHNAPFDLGFLNTELRRMNQAHAMLEAQCTIVDTLWLARRKHPGQKNSLDALCKRYGVDNTQRTLHGALLDAELLADVYLHMTGGQTKLSLQGEGLTQPGSAAISLVGRATKVITATAEEIAAHDAFMQQLQSKSSNH